MSAKPPTVPAAVSPDLGPSLGDHPNDVLAHVLSLRPFGHAVEFGVARGSTLRLISEAMPVTGFDSFHGLPESWRPGFPAGRFACPAPTVPGAELIVGLFADTLPEWTPPGPIGLVHIDCDLYSSTATVLSTLALTEGTYIVFDEFHGYLGCELHEQRAWDEYAARTGVTWDVLGHGPEQWAIRLHAPVLDSLA